MQNGIYITASLSEEEKLAIISLEKAQNQNRNIFYKLDPQAFSANGGEYGHILYYENGALTGYVSLSSFDGETMECAAIAENDLEILKPMLDMVLKTASEKKIKSLLFIIDSNDGFLPNYIKGFGFHYSFTEYRMDFDAEKFHSVSDEDCIDLQPANDGDKEAIASLDEDSFGVINETDLANTRIARQGGKVIGKIRIDDVCGTVGIYGFVVDPKFRGQGYGRKILTSVVSDIIERGFEKVYLEVSSENTAARKLYESVGFFIKTKFDYYERQGELR